MSLYTVAKKFWHTAVPTVGRRALFNALPPFARRKRLQLVRLFERTAKHDEIYDKAYYEGVVEPAMLRSAEVIAASIIADFSPRAVVDVGCGSGKLLSILKARKVSARGLEYSVAALAKCRERQLDVLQFDIENEVAPDWRADVVISTEVAEHLPERCADRFVDLLCGLSEIVVVTAAQPSSACGDDHVNEQPRGYWISKFTHRGYVYESETTVRWQGNWREAGVEGCFSENLMIFRLAQHDRRP